MLKINGELLEFDNKVLKQDDQKIMDLVTEVGVFSQEEIKVSGELVTEKLNDPNCSYNFIFLRDSKKQIIAYSCFGEICLAKDRFDLYWIAVSKKYQKQQLASLILKQTEIAIKKLGGKKLFAETSSLPQYKPAHKFYLKSGFSKAAELIDFYKDGDNKIIFAKDLKIEID